MEPAYSTSGCVQAAVERCQEIDRKAHVFGTTVSGGWVCEKCVHCLSCGAVEPGAGAFSRYVAAARLNHDAGFQRYSRVLVVHLRSRARHIDGS